MNKKSLNTSWGSVAGWYNDVVNDPESYQAKVILPNVLRLISPEKGQKILDLACGQGYFSHAVAARGANITGIDIAPELIEIAKKQAGHNESFIVSPATDLSKLAPRSFDSAFCVLAIQNIERMGDVFKEVSRVLKERGKFVVILNHPAFRIPGKTFWEFDEKAGIQFRRVDEYIGESSKKMDMHPGTSNSDSKDEKFTTISFHRPIQSYSKSLANAGFAISRIEEWMSHRDSEKGPRKSVEDKARREIPLFMCLECVKL
jgi:ubiquinone/menaquinone biosynthesis C-methylase UbiE